MDVGHIICYNLLVIGGSELSNIDIREKYQIKTKFRLLDSGYGKYFNNNILSFEHEEGVRTTSTMSEEDILYFRPVHWLIQMLWNYRIYYDLLKYSSINGINQYDVIELLIKKIDEANPKIVKLFNDFDYEAKSEWFDTPDKMREYYSKNFDKLEKSEFGKLNYKYTWRVLLECKKEFDEYIKTILISLMPENEDEISNIIKFSSCALIDFSTEDIDFHSKTESFDYNIIEWRENKYQSDLLKQKFQVLFNMDSGQKDALEMLLKQYSHKNKNVTLRKMSEHMSINDLFYKTKLL